MAANRDWDIVVVGGINSDYLVRGKQLPKSGQTLPGQTFHDAPGGKGANQAVAVARLGCRVTMIARVGADRRGDELLQSLKDEGVDVSYVQRDGKEPTGAAVIMVDAQGDKQILAAEGANRRCVPDDVAAAVPALRSTKVMLAQLEVPLETVLAAAIEAQQEGAKVVLDPAPAIPLPDELLRLVDVIRPNSSEAQVLTGIEVVDFALAREAARSLRKRGAAAACVQAGERGDLLVWEGGELELPRFQVKRVDATGAGDAFAAALAVSLAEGKPLPESGRFASAAAALATTVLGAQAGLPRKDAVLELLKRG
jgi:ribokinase